MLETSPPLHQPAHILNLETRSVIALPPPVKTDDFQEIQNHLFPLSPKTSDSEDGWIQKPSEQNASR